MPSLNLIIGLKSGRRSIIDQGSRKEVMSAFRRVRGNQKYQKFEVVELWCKGGGLMRSIDFGKAKRKEATAKVEKALEDDRQLAEKLEADARKLALPGALELADEKGVLLHQVKGSGTDGAILAEDVEAFLAAQETEEEDESDT